MAEDTKELKSEKKPPQDDLMGEVPADAEDKPEEKPRKRKKSKRTVASGQVHVKATFNNTIITVTDPKGNVLTTASAGASGFRGSKKGTAYAAQIAAEKAVSAAKTNHGLSKVE